MKIFGILGCLVLGASAFAANSKISNEMIVVKACAEHLDIGDHFDLKKVHDASVTDSGKVLTAALKYIGSSGDVEGAQCTAYSYFDHAGESTACDECLNNPPEDGYGCACTLSVCQLVNGETAVKRTFVK